MGQGRQSIEKEVAEHRAAIEKLQAGLTALDEGIAALRESLRALEEKAAASGQRRDVIDAAMARLQDTATSAKVRIAAAQTAADAADARRTEAEHQVQEARAAAEKAEGEKAQATRRLQEAEEAVTPQRQHQGGPQTQTGKPPPSAGGGRRRPPESRQRAVQRIPAHPHPGRATQRSTVDGYQQSVKSVMRAAAGRRLRGIIGPVAGILTVRKGYEVAIETALGFALQNIVVEDQGCARAAIAFLKEERAGRATFLPLDTVQGSRFTGRLTGTAEVAADLVTTDPKYQHIIDNLLGRIIVVEDLTEASAVARNLGYRNRIVTLDGQVINAGGSFTGGSTAPQRGRIQPQAGAG